MTTTERQAEMLRRGGIDPIRLDKRPLAEVMNDCIPYDRWEKENNLIKRAGFRNRQDYLRNWRK